MNIIDALTDEMLDYFAGDSRRTQHFIKVHRFASIIGKGENLDERTQTILEITGLLHDVGIKVAEAKYGYNNGKMQEEEGPPVAEAMLKKLGCEQDVIDRVSYLVAHHHTYNDIDGLDYQILVEADFLVNLHEKDSSREAITTSLNKIFKTKKGFEICKYMFAV